ncbi:nucleotide exchange factor GrpE [Streptomyces sp. NRRL B-24572]|uniref:nucleotide exchange factor GrpE n=1 Tax=Streptomyces sp. NRRL B-24572 TaxID=1962156 RepID=UPI000A3C3C03|nr:nucleotide exchange factor GrpE [Streptomyces sp. NRRL B-24572]
MIDPARSAAGPPSELDKLRRRVEALSRKRDEAEARLDALLSSLLPLDDVLGDTRRRVGALHEARSAREATSVAVALSEQIDAAHLMLRRTFAGQDVSPMDTVGRAVDPLEMRVVGTEPHPTWPGGTVLRERLTGFRRGAATLRPAEVVVAVTGPAPEPETEPVVDSGPDPVPAGGGRAQPRRTTRSQWQLPRKRPGRRGRRSRRS